jgi:gliding motility-associated-like protein
VAVTIYNRYGQEVFSASDMGQLWNGRTKGGEVAEGTYFYVVRFTPVCDPRPQELKGAVTVVR